MLPPNEIKEMPTPVLIIVICIQLSFWIWLIVKYIKEK
jgi:hypothetical protein